MMWRLIRKEWTAAIRDRRIVLMAGVVTVLIVSAVAVRMRAASVLQRDRTAAAAQFRGEWLAQGRKDAHSAAHFGTFVWKPVGLLNVLDVGTDNFTGSSISLVAHQQSDAAFSRAGDSDGTQRFGELTPALVVELLLPLLVIFAAFASISTERRGGTLALLMVQGASPRAVLGAKLLALFALITLLVGGTLCIALPVLTAVDAVRLAPGDLARLALLGGAWLLFLLVWVAISIAVAGRVRTGQSALLVLLMVWIVTSVFVPRLAANLGDSMYPLPSRLAFEAAVAHDVRAGFNGHDPDSVRLADVTREMLVQYRVDSVSQLPINIDGILAQRGEEYTSAVYDRQFERLRAIMQRQRQVVQLASLVSPYLAVRNVSMALTGTDQEHHDSFQRAAEGYRREMVQSLNRYQTEHSRTGDWAAQSDSTLWRATREFVWTRPTAMTALWSRGVELSALLLLLLGLLLALRTRNALAGVGQA